MIPSYQSIVHKFHQKKRLVWRTPVYVNYKPSIPKHKCRSTRPPINYYSLTSSRYPEHCACVQLFLVWTWRVPYVRTLEDGVEFRLLAWEYRSSWDNGFLVEGISRASGSVPRPSRVDFCNLLSRRVSWSLTSFITGRNSGCACFPNIEIYIYL